LIFFVGGKEPSLHITWTVEKFMSSLPLPFGMLDVASYRVVHQQTSLSSHGSDVLEKNRRGISKVPFDVCHIAFDVLDRSGFHGDQKKRKYFYFYKRKGYKYEDELVSKEIHVTPGFKDKTRHTLYVK
jgi:hypothetical protein